MASNWKSSPIALLLQLLAFISYDWMVSREQAFLPLRYHSSVRRVRPGVRPRGSTGYSASNMGLSEAVILAVVFLWGSEVNSAARWVDSTFDF